MIHDHDKPIDIKPVGRKLTQGDLLIIRNRRKLYKLKHRAAQRESS